MLEPSPFQVRIDAAAIEDLRRRLRDTRWPEAETVDDWSQGIPLAYVQELAAWWADEYDMGLAGRVNAFPQARVELDGLGIHFVHARSPEPDALPLVLTHGWPGSVTEFLDVFGPLSDPRAHGGDPADAFHVVAPSLPGYGWSDKPVAAGWGIERIATAWHELMTGLGYDRYVAQGGDWGAGVTTALAQQAPRGPRRDPPQHGARVPRRRHHGRPHADGGAGARRHRRARASRAWGTRPSSPPVPRRSATGSPTARPASSRGSSRSSGPGPTATATPRAP